MKGVLRNDGSARLGGWASACAGTSTGVTDQLCNKSPSEFRGRWEV
jgi:hypothetical protein